MRDLLIIPIIATMFNTLAHSQNEFAFNFFEVYDKDENLLFSPTSILTAFAMAYEGANGETQRAFEKTFGFSEDNQLFIDNLKQLKESAVISNSLWIQTGYKILDNYIQTIQNKFSSDLYTTDFFKDPENSATKINEWIAESTEGMIKNMVSPADVKAFKMAIVNAIYFKQSWKNKFHNDYTKDEEFTNLDGSKSIVPLMFNRNHYLAYEGENEKIIQLPYADDKTSMIVILPNKMKNYRLSMNTFNQLNKQLYNQEVRLHLPRFTFETKTFELKPFLNKLGLGHAFSDFADFSKMRKEKDLKIGTALHKAKIIVNEEGTEAAAATVIGMVRTTSVSYNPPPVMEMRVDQPFYYFIQDNSTQTILFMGKTTSM